MYYVLKTKEIRLEYLKETLNIEYNKTYFKISGYQIQNLLLVLYNMIKGIDIEHFVIDDLTIQSNRDFICIGDNFILDYHLIDDLIALLNQSEKIRLNLVRPKPNPADSGVGVTNLD